MIRAVLASGFLLLCPLRISGALTLLNEPRHIGIANQPEWSVFEGKTPHGTNLVLSFDAPGIVGEQTLFIRQDDVKQDWTVALNGKNLGRLFLMEAPLVHTLPIPEGLLKAESNRLEIKGKPADDILIHEIFLEAGSKARILEKYFVQVKVRERGRSKPFPCRITILDDRGHLAAFHDFGATNLAARPGVIYTPDGSARIGLSAGKYEFWATRGPEFSAERATIVVPGETEVMLEPERQVDTSGWIAVDTHMHTVTFSKHGDATVRERVITIAGEGLEMPVTTEHNLHADYSNAARELGLEEQFMIVPGNEVTTRKGHFNIFPVSLSAPPPDHSIEHWPDLFSRIRRTPNVQVAIINHPTDVHSGFVPFAATNLDLATGRNLRGAFDFEFDAMEVVNSAAMNSDWMAPFRAWFALLNRGFQITAVASSDSHDVSRFIVGQGRTYVRGDDTKPGRIDIGNACEDLKKGRAVVSLGLFARLEARIAGSRLSPTESGELLKAHGSELELTARIDAPAWIRAAKAAIYANGSVLKSYDFSGGEGMPLRLAFTERLPVLTQDTHFVLITSGPGVTNQFWSVARPYQPSSRTWEPVVIGATNPVWVDADGDGKFSSSRDYARQLVSLPIEKAKAKLSEYDPAVSAHFAELQFAEPK